MPGEYRTTPHPLVKAVLLAANATRLEVRVDSVILATLAEAKKKRKCVKSFRGEQKKKKIVERFFFKEVFMYWFNGGKENVEWLLLSTKSKNKTKTKANKQKQTNKNKQIKKKKQNG